MRDEDKTPTMERLVGEGKSGWQLAHKWSEP